MERWIALDIETTGLSPTRHEIRELAAVPFGIDQDCSEQVLRFAPGDFHGCRPKTRSRLADLLDAVGNDAVLVAHNAVFDVAFLSEALRRARIVPFLLRAYCTLRLSRVLVPNLPRYDLSAMRKALAVDSGRAHVALADARAVAMVFMALVKRGGFTDETALRATHGPLVQAGAFCAWSDTNQ